MNSEDNTINHLKERLAVLEAALDHKEMELQYLNKLVEIAEDALGIDLKKMEVLFHLPGKATKGEKPLD